MGYEKEKAIFEGVTNDYVDNYFNYRPQIIRTLDKERLVEAGFRMAWDYLKTYGLPDDWIKPHDSLPSKELWPTICPEGHQERFIETWLTDGNNVYIGRINGCECHTENGYETEDGEIATHWMPLKKPPIPNKDQ